MTHKKQTLIPVAFMLLVACSSTGKKVAVSNKNNPGMPDVLLPEVKCVQKPDVTDGTHWEQSHLSCEIQKGATWSPK